MVMEDRDTRPGERGGKQFDDPLTDGGWADRRWAFALEGCHGRLVAIAIELVEESEIGADVKKKAEAGDAVAHADADAGNPPAANTDREIILIANIRWQSQAVNQIAGNTH